MVLVDVFVVVPLLVLEFLFVFTLTALGSIAIGVIVPWISEFDTLISSDNVDDVCADTVKALAKNAKTTTIANFFISVCLKSCLMVFEVAKIHHYNAGYKDICC